MGLGRRKEYFLCFSVILCDRQEGNKKGLQVLDLLATL